ncbi:MAG TPA: Npt1/Npt2 family nucleotide transporter [Chlamydiales bacterium]|nr:Npt1/Npt2 family nucleotide transporter [Chlamydiales bacterium]
MLKTHLFPVKRSEWALFGFMFLIVSLINVNFSVLRSMRNALVVADAGGSAAYIPYFELFGTFPASILLTWALSRLMRIFSFRFIFSATMFFFLTFFILFAFWIYPHKEEIHTLLEAKLGLLFGFTRFKVVFTHWPDMVFYIMAELWKVALLSVVFWGFLNQNLSLGEAKRFYPPLLLGTSFGTILSGPITVFCTSLFSWNFFPLSPLRWQHSLYMLTFFLVLCGLATHLLFTLLCKTFRSRLPTQPQKKEEKPFSEKLSLSTSLRYLMESPYLRSLFLIVIAEYVCYTLGELIFLETLKERYPSPAEYCQYMGSLSLWMGILTAVSAIFITPYLLQTYSWGKTALMTPILMVGATVAFFSVNSMARYGMLPGLSAIHVAIVLGSIHFCVGRAAKYTLFDAIKELAFIPLNQEGQVKGKLIIDGIGSRLGRGGSSLVNILLFLIAGGPGESVLFAGVIATSMALMMIPAGRIVGQELEKTSLPATH